MTVIARKFDLTFDKTGKPSHVEGPTCPEYKQHGGFPKSIEVVPAEQLRGAVPALVAWLREQATYKRTENPGSDQIEVIADFIEREYRAVRR